MTAISVDTTARLSHPLAVVLAHIEEYWEELRIGGTLKPGRRPGHFTIQRMPLAVLAMKGRLDLDADGEDATAMRVAGEIYFLGGLTIPMGLGKPFANRMIRRAVEAGNGYISTAQRE